MQLGNLNSSAASGGADPAVGPAEAGSKEIPPPPSGPGSWITPGRFALALAAFIFAAYPQVLLGLQTFVVRDYGFFAYPLAHFQKECFWRGEIPLWNPYSNCGVPFLAQWNTMPLYPPALVYLLLPLAWSLSFFCLAHLFWAGLGMYRLACRWTENPLGAAVAGLVFAFNGLSLNLLMWPSHIATLSWAPWVILLAQKAWREGGTAIFSAALAGTLQMLAGGPETVLFTWCVTGLFWVADGMGAVRNRNPAGAWRYALRLPAVVGLVAALSAIQLLPFFDLVTHSERETGYADTRWSMPGRGWANFFVPLAFGRVTNMGVFFQYDQGWTSSYYLGMGTLALVGLALLAARRRPVPLLTLVCALGVVLALGDQTVAYKLLRQALPQISMITYPVKFLILVVIAAPLLAAFGVRELVATERAAGPSGTPGQTESAKAREKRLFAVAGAILAALAAVLAWAWLRPLPYDNPQATLVNGLSRALFLAGAVSLLVAIGRGRLRPGLGVPLVLALFWLDVWTHCPNQNPSVPAWVYQPGLARAQLKLDPAPELGGPRAMVAPAAETRFIQFAMSQPKENLIVKRLGLFANCNLLDGIPKVSGFFSLYPREIGELTSAIYGETNRFFPNSADFMCVAHVTEPEKFHDWARRDTWMPLVTAGQRPVFVPDRDAVSVFTTPEFDGRRVVILNPDDRARVSVTNAAVARVTGQNCGLRSVTADIEAESPALVTIAQTFYHRWQAKVDGAPVPLLRANYAFQAVQVPAGKHQVRLDYRDPAFETGACVSGLALLLCAGGWAFLVWKGRRNRGSLRP